MTWTSSKPTKPGWYWWYGGEDTEMCIWYIGQTDIDRGRLYGQFAGPLEPPAQEGER